MLVFVGVVFNVVGGTTSVRGNWNRAGTKARKE